MPYLLICFFDSIGPKLLGHRHSVFILPMFHDHSMVMEQPFQGHRMIILRPWNDNNRRVLFLAKGSYMFCNCL